MECHCFSVSAEQTVSLNKLLSQWFGFLFIFLVFQSLQIEAVHDNIVTLQLFRNGKQR